MKFTLAAVATCATAASAFTPTSSFLGKTSVSTQATASNGSNMDMRYKVAVIGGGPSGACAAEIFAQEKGIDTVMFERKMDNAKPCGGAIPLCMVGEFDIPETVVDRKVGFYDQLLKFNSFLRSFPKRSLSMKRRTTGLKTTISIC
jgi:geranylgeranyl reductase